MEKELALLRYAIEDYTKRKCLRRDLEECPYRHKEVDYEHWCHKAGQSREFAEERADYYCRGMTCQLAILSNY